MAADIQQCERLWRYILTFSEAEQSILIWAPWGTHSLGLVFSGFPDEAVKPTAKPKTKPKSTLWGHLIHSRIIKKYWKNVVSNLIAGSRSLIVQVSWQTRPPAGSRFHDFIRRKREAARKLVIRPAQYSCNFLEGKTRWNDERIKNWKKKSKTAG